MKKLFLSFILILPAAMGVIAQIPVTSLSEDFDLSCLSSSGFPVNWSLYNPVTGTAPSGAWTCGPGEGRAGTPGIVCTGTYGTPSAYHLDTSYLITPLLNFSGYAPDSVFLRFDTKTTNIHLGGRLSILESNSPDSSFHVPGTTDTDITATMFPVIGNSDSSGWVTHEVQLTEFETTGPFYVAFRYVSTSASGNTWYLDNINTSTIDLILNVPSVEKTELPLKVIGSTTSEQITLSYSVQIAGSYNLAVYDMMGRIVHKESLNAVAGTYTYQINNLNLPPGMYLVKMGNGTAYGTAKTIVP